MMRLTLRQSAVRVHAISYLGHVQVGTTEGQSYPLACRSHSKLHLELSDLETLWLIVHATKVMDKDQTTLHTTILKETETNE